MNMISQWTMQLTSLCQNLAETLTLLVMIVLYLNLRGGAQGVLCTQ